VDYVIESNQNKTVKYIVSLQSKKGRELEKKFLVEGEKFVAEIPENWDVCFYAVSESYAGRNDLKRLKDRSIVHIMKDSVFRSVSDTMHPQGIMAVCGQRRYTMDMLLNNENAFIIVLEETNDPGNLGTIIRTADAAGADGVILSKGSADVYNPKVIRASAGSVFHIPFVCNMDLNQALPMLKEKGIVTCAAHLKGDVYPYNMEFKKSAALLIGNEARGLSEESAKMADVLIKLPILGMAESLNASIAGGILIYEVVRQRIQI
jgi:TrmH family RNA methyltransferase